jgi:hypothetical protein
MKSTCNIPTLDPELTFPFLGKLKTGSPGNTSSDIVKIVLFTSPGPESYTHCGVVVHTNAPNGPEAIGQWSDRWIIDAFEELPAGTTVTITV